MSYMNRIIPSVSRELNRVEVTDIQTSSGEITQDTTWFDFAACKGKTHLMFPKEHKDISYIHEARALCDECCVRPNCKEYVLDFPAADLHGVWAGMTPRQVAAEQKRLGVRPSRPTIAQMQKLY